MLRRCLNCPAYFLPNPCCCPQLLSLAGPKELPCAIHLPPSLAGGKQCTGGTPTRDGTWWAWVWILSLHLPGFIACLSMCSACVPTRWCVCCSDAGPKVPLDPLLWYVHFRFLESEGKKWRYLSVLGSKMGHWLEGQQKIPFSLVAGVVSQQRWIGVSYQRSWQIWGWGAKAGDPELWCRLGTELWWPTGDSLSPPCTLILQPPAWWRALGDKPGFAAPHLRYFFCFSGLAEY